MSLVPFDPFQHIENIKKELNRFLSPNFSLFGDGLSFEMSSIQLQETEDEIIATCQIPEPLKMEDLRITIRNHVLSVSGAINHSQEMKSDKMHHKQEYVGQFQRSVYLPIMVHTNYMKTLLKNGKLEIRFPKMTGFLNG